MSRIEDLIRQHCPHGVEFRALGDVLSYEQPTKYLVASTDYSPDHETPVLTAGQTFVLGYTDETDGIYQASPRDPVIIFDDFTTAFKWVDFPFKAKSSAMKMLTLRPDAPTTLRFVWYAMQLIRYSPQDHARQWISTYSSFTVPLPPLDIQREIVRVLDLFQSLEAELEAELEARRRQYAHYRDSLLAFSDSRERVRWVTLADVASFQRGVSITEKQTVPGPIPVVANGPDVVYMHDTANRTGETVVVARSGAHAGSISYWSEPIFLTDAFSVHPDERSLRSRFLYYYLLSRQRTIKASKKGAGVPHVRAKELVP